MIELFNGKTTFVWNIWNIIGLFFLIAGGIIEFWVRKLLVKKADFSDQLFTMLLKINFKHQLLKIGPFKYVRHPLYTGMLIQGTGMGLLSQSIYGSLFILIGLAFLIPRIQIEEIMLIEEFGNEYREYQKSTKKIIPFVY